MSLIKPVWPVLAAMAFLILQPGSSRGQEWGSLKGRIIYGDAAPAAVPLDIERDADVCGKNGLVDESLVVHPENRGLRYVAVWLESKTPMPIHPELVNFPADSPVLDNINCRFEPHMLTLRTGQILQLKNSDPVAHNAAVYVRRTTPFSEVIPQNAPVEKKFAKAENLPTRVDCSIHAWMKMKGQGTSTSSTLQYEYLRTRTLPTGICIRPERGTSSTSTEIYRVLRL